MNNSIGSSAPHIRSGNNEFLFSLDIMIAALPAIIWSIIAYGMRPLAVIAVAMLSGALFDLIYAVIFKGGARVFNSAVLGMIIALFMPAGINYIIIPIAVFIAVTLRRFLGGVINPIAAALVPFFIFTGMMTAHTEAFVKLEIGVTSYWDQMNELAAETPLEVLMSGVIPNIKMLDLFLGNATESIGAMSALLLILGGIYLLARRTISWQSSVGYLGGAIVVWFFLFFDGAHYEYLVYHFCAGGIFLGAFFGVTEHSSAPVTQTGRFIHGIGCGALTMLFRKLGFAAESVLLSMLVMSIFSRVLDMITAERYFGYHSKKIGERLGTLLPSRTKEE
ncbi:MAG: RnfABCDGE type electron transport complex subunit D [Clostridia bacterium]|nr:RnfABCDGE type electron transport complex subunit D [Clostridia bacterium]